MNRDDIIRMAREAGCASEDASDLLTLQNLERFAALVAAAQREAYERVCEERDAIVKDADKAYALLRQALDALIFVRPACFAEIRRTKADAAINALREWLGVTE